MQRFGDDLADWIMDWLLQCLFFQLVLSEEVEQQPGHIPH